MMKQLLADLPQSPNATIKTQSQIGETAEQQVSSPAINQKTEKAVFPEKFQLPPSKESPIAGLLMPATENFELPKATADTVPALAKNYQDFATRFDQPRTPTDLKNKKAINQTVTNIVDNVDKNEFYNSIGAEPDLSLSNEEQYQDFIVKVTQVVMQGLTSSEGNLQQIIYAGGKQESILSGNQELSAILDNGIANYKLYNKAQKIEAQSGKSDNSEQSNNFYGKAFLNNLFQYNSDEVFTTDPQLAFILANILYAVNPSGQQPPTYLQIRDLAASGDLLNKTALVSQIGNAAGNVFRTNQQS